MATLKHGYAVGGDDTHWRNYITDRIAELEADYAHAHASRIIKPDNVYINVTLDPDKNFNRFHDTVQTLLGVTKI